MDVVGAERKNERTPLITGYLQEAHARQLAEKAAKKEEAEKAAQRRQDQLEALEAHLRSGVLTPPQGGSGKGGKKPKGELRGLLSEGDSVAELVMQLGASAAPRTAKAIARAKAGDLNPTMLDEDWDGADKAIAWMRANCDESLLDHKAACRLVVNCVLDMACVDSLEAKQLCEHVTRCAKLFQHVTMSADERLLLLNQITCLYAVQDFYITFPAEMGKDWPRDLLNQLFFCLYENYIVSKEAFWRWRKGSPNVTGKATAVIEANAFLQWLEKAEEKGADGEAAVTRPAAGKRIFSKDCLPSFAASYTAPRPGNIVMDAFDVKKPLSRFEFFGIERKDEIMEAIDVHHKPATKEDLSKLVTKLLGAAWHELSEEDKLAYEAKAAKDKERYAAELRAMGITPEELFAASADGVSRAGSSSIPAAPASAGECSTTEMTGDESGGGSSGSSGGTVPSQVGTTTKMLVNYDTLLDAVQNGDMFLVQAWLDNVKEQAETILNDNPSLLYHAALGKNPEMVRMLLEAKADPNACFSEHFAGHGKDSKWWPLRLTVHQLGHTEICKLLLEHGARIEPPANRTKIPSMSAATGGADDDSGCLLGCAAFKGHLDIVQLLLDAQADVDGRRADGKLPTFLTPLMHAAYNGRPGVVQLLLERRAEPNAGHQTMSHTALDFAELQEQYDCVALLEAYKLPSMEELVACLEKADTDVLQRWVSRGGGINHYFTAQMPEGRAQVPLLVYASMKGQDAVVKWLLDHKADLDVHIRGDPQPTEADGHTPLMRACIAGHALVVRRLLRAGAKLAQRSSTGQTALQLAEKHKKKECEREFKDHLLSIAAESRAAKALKESRKALKQLDEADNALFEATKLVCSGLQRSAAAEDLIGDTPDERAKAAALLESLEAALSAHANAYAESRGGDRDDPSRMHDESISALELRERLRQQLQASARKAAEASLRRAIDAVGKLVADRPASELAEVLSEIKSAIATHSEAASGSAVLKDARALRDKAAFDTGRANVPESTLGGETTCIVCFANPKTHLAAPCGHMCACGPCSEKMPQCPYCRADVLAWAMVRFV